MQFVLGVFSLLQVLYQLKGFPAPKVFSRSVCVVFCNVVLCGCVCKGGKQRAQ